ncbi:eukaryotic translation initiation factor 4E transporter-like [Mercenaria mercenaria]|uniref:eukaryotic translation initiation factor 4E transporter-like n=1 Tax=Mercenaria mercenaria TaxID=6596 RepID=UPI00234F7390|nr:eukaryotic translation initiation factor 4E transporter-like [Mercenaria mercenaria]
MDRESDRGSSEAGSGRGTPRSLDHETLRSDTPGTMPTYQYSLDELYDLEKAPASRLIPDCLDKEFIVDGIWDAEKWHRSFGSGGPGSKSGSRGPSPLNALDPRERRSEMLRRNSGSSANPKDRLKEEKDMIVLSPQRRSFGTGCHVSQQPLLQRAISNMETDRERREQRRIGSGRIQIDRERGRDQEYRSEREYRNDRGQDRVSERDSRDFRSDRHIDKDPRDFRSARENDRDRDFRNPRDRFDRDDRKFDRDRIFSRRDMDDRRDFRDHGSRYNNRRDRRDSHREEEPEWFSSGPISKTDTIELHGFERDRRDSDRQKDDRANDVPKVKQKETRKQQEIQAHEEAEISDEEERRQEGEGVSVADRNGSLETNESSSPETNQSDVEIRPAKSVTAHIPSFDFNEFFNIDNIPGLSAPDESVADTDPANIGGSRFYQLYRTSLAGNQQANVGSKENSRRSSLMEDEFGYLNDLLNGSKSPVIPSPPPPSASSVFERSTFLTPFASSDKQHHLEFGTVGQKFVASSNTLVNALINNAAVLEKNRSSPTGMRNLPQETEAKLKALLFGRLDSASSSGNTTPGFNSPLNAPGKVKTVAELEGELQQANTPVRSITPPSQQNRSLPQGGNNDLTAFNKLISLMQAGAARPVESPKQPIKAEARPPSPLSNIPGHIQQAHLHQHIIQSQQAGIPSQIQGVPQQTVMPSQIQAGHQQSGMPSQLQAGSQQAGMPSQIQAGSQQHGIPPQLHAGPPQPLQGRVIHKPEPLNLQGHQLQNQRASVGEMPFDMMDNYPGNMHTPTSVAPPQHGLSDATAAQKQFLEALQRNKEQQLQIRQAAIQNMRSNHPVSTQGQQAHLASQLASQHSSVQQQVQQNNIQGRRPSSGDPVMSFLKANPTIITKPASPTPPPQQQPQIPIMNFVQPGSSPRGPSPSPLQSALLSRQAQGSPRVPSPIMFSQQPPMHLSAPSPIHPAQGGSSLSQSPVGQPANTSTVNTIRPPSVPRVPSPQELIVHTQAILQNALIKKQLEDQKERFYKKQQERVKSPAMVGSKIGQDGIQGPTRTSPAPVTSTPVAAKSAVNVAFTPTSVIRKMHSEKASEKEKQRRDSADLIEATERDNQVEHGSELENKAQDQQVSPLRLDHPVQHCTSAPPTSIPPPAMIHAVPPPPLPNQVLPNMVAVLPGLPPFNTNQLTHLPPPPPLVSTHLPPPLLSPGALPPPPHPQSTALVTQEQIDAVKSQHIRALIGQQNVNVSLGASLAAVSTALPTTGRPIVKGNVSVAPPLATPTSKDHVQRPIMGGSTPVVSAVDMAKLLQRQNIRGQTTTPYGIPVAGGRMPLPTSPVVGPQPPALGTSPVYIQQMVPGTSPRGYNQYPQLTGLQAQQRMIDPRAARGPIVQTSLQSPGFNPRTLNPQMSQHKSMDTI